MRRSDLHSALKTVVLADTSSGGISYKHVRLQHGRNEFTATLHAHPGSFSTAGIQATDFLHFLGFSRSPCPFHGGECYCRSLDATHDVSALAGAIGSALEKFKLGARDLEKCGLFIGQPEGLGYFFGSPSTGRLSGSYRPSGDGHIAPITEKMKESEDAFFRFVLTWIDGAGDKGWTTHYRAKHMPLAPEFQAALDFLGGFSWFSECPEFEFDGCWWWFIPFEKSNNDMFSRSADTAHGFFDAHAADFSSGLEQLLAAHADLEPFQMSFLRTYAAAAIPTGKPASVRAAVGAAAPESTSAELSDRFDVAVSFAGARERSRGETCQ